MNRKNAEKWLSFFLPATTTLEDVVWLWANDDLVNVCALVSFYSRPVQHSYTLTKAMRLTLLATNADAGINFGFQIVFFFISAFLLNDIPTQERQ